MRQISVRTTAIVRKVPHRVLILWKKKKNKQKKKKKWKSCWRLHFNRGIINHQSGNHQTYKNVYLTGLSNALDMLRGTSSLDFCWHLVFSLAWFQNFTFGLVMSHSYYVQFAHIPRMEFWSYVDIRGKSENSWGFYVKFSQMYHEWTMLKPRKKHWETLMKCVRWTNDSRINH